MNVNEVQFMGFPNMGFIINTFTDEQLQPVRDEVSEILQDFEGHKHNRNNNTLAGNIEYEFNLVKSKKTIEQLVVPLLAEYNKIYRLSSKIDVCSTPTTLTLTDTWVNIQKKGEFNPMHRHTGVFSFALYLHVPYLIEDELKNTFSVGGNRNVPAHFEFEYTDVMGNICSMEIPVDKRYENKILVFPANMVHTVYPFYSSDDYRISVSGNFKLDTGVKND